MKAYTRIYAIIPRKMCTNYPGIKFVSAVSSLKWASIHVAYTTSKQVMTGQEWLRNG